MALRGTTRLTFGCIAVLALLVLAAPAAARSARATVTGCQADHMTVVGAVTLSGRDARRARGAVLQLRFTAMPLFGLPRPSVWRTIGKKTKGSSQETFTGLPADSWVGVMSWRFKKGRKTVASGVERSQPGRVGRTRGAAFCTLPEGAKPADTVPPQLFISPLDEIWHHGPAHVTLLAQDDFSGVRSVAYSLDGGPLTPIRNGAAFTIDSEGAHSVHWAATDVAGNTATRDAVVRVDLSQPAKPAMTSPYSVTANTSPTFGWTASSDTGSGLRGYFLQIKRASDGSVVAFMPFRAGTTSTPSPTGLSDGETYVASVIAVDNTDVPFSSESDPLTFRVDTHPGISSSNPGDGGIVPSSAAGGPFTVTLDRPADSATVATSTVTLTGVDPASTPNYSVSCDASCTTITVTPQNKLGEGRYTIVLGGVKSQEGVGIPGTVHFAVPFAENDTASNNLCVGTGTAQKSYIVPTNDSLEQGRFTFDWSLDESATWHAQAFDGSTPLGPEISRSGTSGNGEVLTFNLGAKSSSSFTLKFTVDCASTNTTLSVSNLLGTRLP